MTVALVPGSDPVSGEIEVRGRTRAFKGWMELTALLDQARGEAAPGA